MTICEQAYNEDGYIVHWINDGRISIQYQNKGVTLLPSQLKTILNMAKENKDFKYEWEGYLPGLVITGQTVIEANMKDDKIRIFVKEADRGPLRMQSSLSLHADKWQELMCYGLQVKDQSPQIMPLMGIVAPEEYNESCDN